MKKLSLFAVLGVFVMVSGCSLTGGNSDSSGSGSVAGEFGVASCDKYVSVMNCLMAKIPAEGQAQYKTTLDQVVSTWKSLDATKLQEACNTTMDALQAQATTFEQAGCPIK